MNNLGFQFCFSWKETGDKNKQNVFNENFSEEIFSKKF